MLSCFLFFLFSPSHKAPSHWKLFQLLQMKTSWKKTRWDSGVVCRILLISLLQSQKTLHKSFLFMFLIIFKWEILFNGVTVMELWKDSMANTFEESLLLISRLNWVNCLFYGQIWHKCFPVSRYYYFRPKSLLYPTSFVLPKGLPAGFVQLHTLWGQGHTMPRGGTSFQEAGHSSSCEPGGRHLVAGQEGWRL